MDVIEQLKTLFAELRAALDEQTAAKGTVDAAQTELTEAQQVAFDCLTTVREAQSGFDVTHAAVEAKVDEIVAVLEGLREPPAAVPGMLVEVAAAVDRYLEGLLPKPAVK